MTSDIIYQTFFIPRFFYVFYSEKFNVFLRFFSKTVDFLFWKKSKKNDKQYQNLFFSTIQYAETISDGENQYPFSELCDTITVVTGIAKPAPFTKYLKAKNVHFEHRKFPDHHNFTEVEIAQLNTKECILTTEKDFMRLKDNITVPLYYLPIETAFVENEEQFLNRINRFITEFKE